MQKCRLPSFFLTSTTSITPGTLARSNGTRLQHLPQMVPNFLNHWWWDLSESFLKRSIISHLYSMLCRVSAAQLCLGLMRICHGIQQGAGRLHPPTLEPMNQGHLNLVHQTAYHVFA